MIMWVHTIITEVIIFPPHITLINCISSRKARKHVNIVDLINKENTINRGSLQQSIHCEKKNPYKKGNFLPGYLLSVIY